MTQMPLPPSTRRPSKPAHGLEELIAAHEGHLVRPPGKSIHHGHPAASHRLRLEEDETTLEELPAPILEEAISTSARFYAYGALKLSGTQVSSIELLPPDETPEITQIDRQPSRSSK